MNCVRLNNIFLKYLKILALGCVILLFGFNAFAEITLSIYPTPVVAGEESSLIINSTESKAIIKDLPDVRNLQWIHNNVQSQNLMIVNGVKYIKTSYPFIVKKPGKIALPSMTISVDGKKELSTAKKEILVSTGPLSNLENMLFLKCEFPTGKKTYYVGEDIPMKVEVYKSTDLTADPVEYPQIKMNNILFDNFKNNPQSDKFAPYPYETPKKVTVAGIDYIKTTFYTTFRSLAEGDLKGVASLAFRIRVNRNNSRSSRNGLFDDPFFSNSFFGNDNYVTRIINSKIPELKISPLPSPPAGNNYLGLIGDWNVKAEANYDILKEGEPITVTLDITGYGSTENLNAPDINIPGFNTYSPEVLNNSDKISGKQKIKIDYVLIPIESGKTNLNLKFCTFNIKSGKYETTKISKKLNIAKGDDIGIKSAYMSNTNEIAKPKKSKVSNSILYIAVNPGHTVNIPLYKNWLFSIMFLLIAGPVILILTELFRFRKKYITGTKGFERKNRALKKKNKIVKNIKNSKSMKELADTVQQEVIPYINDVNDYPPGTTVNDLETKLNNKELLQPLKDAETMAYMPGDEGNTHEMKKRILKAMKHFSMFALVVAVMFIASNNKMYGAKAVKSDIAQFAKYYNAGKFNDALDICKKHIDMSAPNPGWIYNLGNCYFQKGDYAKALVFYERALRLEPRNSDILENLNFVRRKLFLPEVYQTKTPYELMIFLRDHLRMDEWLLIIAAAWFVLFIGFAIRRKTPARIWITICAIAAFVGIVSSAAYLTEKTSLYNSNKAIVVERNVKVYSLPTKESPDAGFSLNSGDSVNIEENLQDWIRIRKGKTEGWIKDNTAEQIWPY